MILAGRVQVNGKTVKEVGTKADPDVDQITVDRVKVNFDVDFVYLVLNKPLGYVSTVKDRHADHTVMDLVKGIPQRVYPVGRLDSDSAGLLFLTNDGEFTKRLTHPSHQIEKTYRVLVRGDVPAYVASDLSSGVMLDDGMTEPAKVEWIDYQDAHNVTVMDITIHEGRNRQIRRMLDVVGFPVLALTRMKIGPINLTGIAPGSWRKLHPSEVKALLLAGAETAPRTVVEVQPEQENEQLAPSRRASERPRKTGRPASGSGAGSKSVAVRSSAPVNPELRSAAQELTKQLSRIRDEDGEGSDGPPRPRKPQMRKPS